MAAARRGLDVVRDNELKVSEGHQGIHGRSRCQLRGEDVLEKDEPACQQARSFVVFAIGVLLVRAREPRVIQVEFLDPKGMEMGRRRSLGG